MKKKINDNLTLIRFFEVVINEEGYWNYNQMALQVGDVIDILMIKYKHSNVDFLFLMDQSSVHGRMRDGALNANNMSVWFGGKQGMLQKTRLRDVSPYQKILAIGDEQSMIFEDGDQGPFYLKPKDQFSCKYDQFKGRMKIMKKTKRQLMGKLKTKGFSVRKYYSREEIEELAQNYKTDLTYDQQDVIEG